MLELTNFGHMTTSTKQFESRDNFLLVTIWAKIITSLHLFQNTHISRRPRVAIFADIIKIVNMFIKTIFKDSKTVERVRNCFKIQSISVFLDTEKSADFR